MKYMGPPSHLTSSVTFASSVVGHRYFMMSVNIFLLSTYYYYSLPAKIEKSSINECQRISVLQAMVRYHWKRHDLRILKSQFVFKGENKYKSINLTIKKLHTMHL